MFNFFPFSLLKIWRPITTIFNILKVRWDIRTFVKFACTCVIRYGPEILVQCKINPARSWIKFFMKGCLKIASIVLHTRLVYLMKLGVCMCSKNDNRSQFSNTQARTRTVLQSFVLGLLSDNDNQHFSPMSVQHIFTMRVPRSFVLCLFVN